MTYNLCSIKQLFRTSIKFKTKQNTQKYLKISLLLFFSPVIIIGLPSNISLWIFISSFYYSLISSSYVGSFTLIRTDGVSTPVPSFKKTAFVFLNPYTQKTCSKYLSVLLSNSLVPDLSLVNFFPSFFPLKFQWFLVLP